MTLPTPVLETERLRLRPFTDIDADDLFALQSNAYVLRYWDSPPWVDRTSAAPFMAGCHQMAEEGSGARVVIEHGTDQAFLGWYTFNSWNPEFRSASLGHCLNEAAWCRGYATEAARPGRPAALLVLTAAARTAAPHDPRRSRS